MKTKAKRIACIALCLAFMHSIFPCGGVRAAQPEVEAISYTVTAQREDGSYITLSNGEKGAAHDIISIKFEFDDNLVVPDMFNLSYNVSVTANGSIDEKYKFYIDYWHEGKYLWIKLKNGIVGDQTNPCRLMEHALYNIHIPQGVFTSADGSKVNAPIDFCFTTDSDDPDVFHKTDILRKVAPGSGQSAVDCSQGNIVFEFMDEIALNENVLSNPEAYIEVSTEPFNENIPSYAIPPSYTGSDSVSNYDITVDGSRLMLKAKQGILKDFAKYTVRLKDGTVYLKDCTGTRIYNSDEGGSGYTTVRFDTCKMIESTYPQNNQENVELNPVLEFKIKYPFEIVNYDKLRVTSEDSDNFLLSASVLTTWRSGEPVEQKLQILVKAPDGGAIRKSTLHEFVMEQGALRLRDYAGADGQPIFNEAVRLRFITAGEGESPAVKGYSSNLNNTDDITSLETTMLDAGGSIYIHFDSLIRQDRLYEFYPLAGVFLYKIPQAASTSYDPWGRVFDEDVKFYTSVSDAVYKVMPASVPRGSGPEDVENKDYLQEVALQSVAIVNGNILKITPLNPLNNLNKYKVFVDRNYIEGINGYNLEKSLEFTFWTKPASQRADASWEGIDEPGLEHILENGEASHKSYTLFGTKKYGPSSPLVLNLSGEAIVKARDEVVQERPERLSRINFDALGNISLVDAYNTQTDQRNVEIMWYELFYYFDGGVKKTRLKLYPSSDLENGRQYKLSIPSGVLETRSGNDIGALELEFAVTGDSAGPRGVLSLENHTFRAYDLAAEGKWEFIIRGYNFVEGIERVVLTPIAGSAVTLGPISVSSDDAIFKDVTAIAVKLRGDIARELAKESRTGTYTVTVYFSDSPGTGYVSPVGLTVISRGKPEVIELYPHSSDNESWFDENALNPVTVDGQTRYFLKVAFRDNDGSLTFSGESGLLLLKNNSGVYAKGSAVSMIDSDFLNSVAGMEPGTRGIYIEKYIFNKDARKKEAYLYVPVKLLKPQTTYQVVISQGIVRYSDAVSEDSSNDTISWSFTTMASPAAQSILEGSLPENYDEDEPVILTGDLFYSGSVSVYFGGSKADRVRVKTGADGGKYLEVYLPDGKDRLKPGIYNIIVSNDENHEQIIYGSLSILKEGEHLPDAEGRIKKSTGKGDVTSDLKVSADTIELNRRYTDNRLVELDLDELMGEDVLVRMIKFKGSKGDVIGTLKTRSKWCDIDIYGLTLDPHADDNEILIRLGRVEPAVNWSIKSRLKGSVIKSEIIQVSGRNFSMQGIVIYLPFDGGDAENIKAMRYDEEERRWHDVMFSVDGADMTVKIESDKPGIFLIVE